MKLKKLLKNEDFTQIISVVYALHSKSAETIEGLLINGTEKGQMQYWDGTTWVAVNPGTTGQTLTFCDGVPTWGTCPISLPSLTTAAISSITNSTAISGGNVTDDGGGGTTIMARGVCYATSSTPTIDNDKTSDGTGIGVFTSTLEYLTGRTTYYVRAYATNSAGTGYGNTISFTTQPSSNTTLTDIEGNVYETVVIGNQEWMSSNLQVTNYADGTAIPLITDDASWGALADNNVDEAYCYYNNDESNEAYGALYTWAAAMGDNAVSSNNDPSGVQGVCPNGWHLSSDAEWTELIDYIEQDVYSQSGGYALKAIRGWSNAYGDDNFGFSALPGGYRHHGNGYSRETGNFGCWWSSTENNSTEAWRLLLNNQNQEVNRSFERKSQGFSVRCVKD